MFYFWTPFRTGLVGVKVALMGFYGGLWGFGDEEEEEDKEKKGKEKKEK